MSTWKLAIGIIAAAGLLVAASASNYLPTGVWPESLSSWTKNDLSKLGVDILRSTFVVLVAGIITYNIRSIPRLLRRTIQSTDEQIIGEWHVYRYGMKSGKPLSLGQDEVWKIRRTLARTYAVRIYSSVNNNKVTGAVVYKERDRLNILMAGVNHKQQSLISFQLTIPSIDDDGLYDTRLLGVGVGDDSDYVVSARVYFACRTKLPKDYVASIIDAATTCLRSGGPLLQIPASAIFEIFKSHPLPSECRFKTEIGIFHLASRGVSLSFKTFRSGLSIFFREWLRPRWLRISDRNG